MVLPFLLASIAFAQSPTEKQILEQLQKIDQRLQTIESKLEKAPTPTPSFFDPEKKVFGFRLVRGPKGNRATNVMQGSPADKAGVHSGDLILALDGEPVTSLGGHELLVRLDEKDMFRFSLESKKGEKREVDIARGRQGDFMGANGSYTMAGASVHLAEVDIGQAAPEIVAKTAAGGEIKLSSLKGKVVLVNFTATWCGPCRDELPKLIEAYDKHHKDGFEVISVFLDERPAEVERYIKAKQIPWPFFCDSKGWDNAMAREWGIGGVPTNPIIDKAGKIVEDDVRGEEIATAVEKYLK